MQSTALVLTINFDKSGEKYTLKYKNALKDVQTGIS